MRGTRGPQYLERWLAEGIRPSLAPSTASNYAMFVRLYIVPSLGTRRLDKLGVRDVQSLLNELKTRCQCCAQGKDAARRAPRCCAAGRCCNQVPAEWTVHQALRVLRSALTNAVREELVSRNVAALVRISLPRRRKATRWMVEEARRFLESARVEDDPYYVAYVLILVLGLRRGEVLALAWADISAETGEAFVGWQVQRVNGELLRRPTKTPSSDAPLPLPGLCASALKARRL
jgi:integrase